jgi:large subunit ribosomal protein L25
MGAKAVAAERRVRTGKNENRRLRNEGYIPAVVYSHGETDVLKIKAKDFQKLFSGHISESIIFNIDLAGEKDTDLSAFVKDYQVDPVTGSIIHVDLFKITKGEKIQTVVAIELEGTPPGLKMGGHLEFMEREISIECLPKDLPEKITVDVSGLEVGDSIHAGDIDLGEGVELMSFPETVVVAVHEARAEEEPVEEEEEEEEAASMEEESEITEEEE